MGLNFGAGKVTDGFVFLGLGISLVDTEAVQGGFLIERAEWDGSGFIGLCTVASTRAHERSRAWICSTLDPHWGGSIQG